MTDHHPTTQTTPKDFLFATLGGLFAPGVAIFMIVMLFLGIQGRMGEADAAPAAEKEIQARIQPFGSFVAVDPNAPKVELTGEQVYGQVCANCHGSGALGSPKFESAADWGPRLAQGYETLLGHALSGIRSMPARGGEPDLTDLEVARGMVYMANSAGAQFEAAVGKDKVPTVAELTRGREVYATDCAYCHDTGLTGAQKLDDAKAWSVLLKKSREVLYGNAIQGTLGGPAKGGNAKLSDEDTRLAVDYMIEQARVAMPGVKAAEAQVGG
ncbi:MAG TPA: c-type cytochrome [Thiobacillaceae bacterium]|nr:c-type cytochrome [Thiobacillaceae bacterium]HNU63829.1 c-type cytochrome [Thiobacillaceae bacterium]